MNFLSQNELRIRIVQSLVKLEFWILPRPLDGPPGKAPRHLRHILLRVTAINTERVQLHQLASVIFIQPAFVLLFLLSLWWTPRERPSETPVSRLLPHGAPCRQPLGSARIGAQKIIKIEEHRGTLGRRRQQIFELPQRVRLDHIALIGGQIPAIFALPRNDTKVTEPEIIL